MLGEIRNQRPRLSASVGAAEAPSILEDRSRPDWEADDSFAFTFPKETPPLHAGVSFNSIKSLLFVVNEPLFEQPVAIDELDGNNFNVPAQALVSKEELVRLKGPVNDLVVGVAVKP